MKGAVYWFFHFKECFKADTLRRSHRQILTVLLCCFIKDYIFLAILLVEGFAQGTQRRDVIIALSIKRFKSFMTEVSILLKPVHWLGFYMIGTSVMKELKALLCEGLAKKG